jgi:DNA invertase Pin-like site-specific DNA recombinase
VRESTPGQALEDRNSPALQRADIDRFVAKHGLEPPDREYFDAANGKSTTERPGLQATLSDAEAGDYEMLLCYSSARSFRNEEDAAISKGKLRRAGVTLVFTEIEIISGN